LGATGGSVTLLASSKPKEKPAEKPAAERPVAAVVKPKEEKAAEKPVAEAKPSEPEPTTVAVDEDDEIKRITAEAEALTSQLNAAVEKDVQIQGGIESIIKKIVYPETAIHMKIEGKVVARVFVDAKGNVSRLIFLSLLTNCSMKRPCACSPKMLSTFLPKQTASLLLEPSPCRSTSRFRKLPGS
jgi:hypothetical protein